MKKIYKESAFLDLAALERFETEVSELQYFLRKNNINPKEFINDYVNKGDDAEFKELYQTLKDKYEVYTKNMYVFDTSVELLKEYYER